jgi:hypothetical protein
MVAGQRRECAVEPKTQVEGGNKNQNMESQQEANLSERDPVAATGMTA